MVELRRDPSTIIPVPSVQTIELLRREIASLRDVMDIRFEGMDKASDLLKHNFDRVPTDTDRQVEALRDITGEKFDGLGKAITSLSIGIEKSLASLSTGIQLQFEERDIRSRAAELAAQVAVNAALQAQKEAAAAQVAANAAAITKSEAATATQIDGIFNLLAANTKTVDEKNTAVISLLSTNTTEKFEGINKALIGLSLGTEKSIVSLSTGIQLQFEERDIRSGAAELAAQVAVNAALQAQKEAAAAQVAANAAAITKSEAATAKQIDGIFNLLAANTKTVDEKNTAVVSLLSANTKTSDDKIADLTGRLNRAEGRDKGSSGTVGVFVGVGGIAIAVISILLTFMSRMHS